MVSPPTIEQHVCGVSRRTCAISVAAARGSPRAAGAPREVVVRGRPKPCVSVVASNLVHEARRSSTSEASFGWSLYAEPSWS